MFLEGCFFSALEFLIGLRFFLLFRRDVDFYLLRGWPVSEIKVDLFDDVRS